jgi:predicted O-methyltransferase YrrM
VVLDHDTAGYVRRFNTVRGFVAPGGAVVADNVLATENTAEVLSPAGLLATLDGERAPNDRTSAVADFYQWIEADPDFETYSSRSARV